MFWVCQSNLYNEYGYHALMTAIERRDIKHVVVKPVSTTLRFVAADFDSFAYKGQIEDVPEPIVDDSGLVMVCGAVTLSNIAKNRGWMPGSFINDDFHFDKWREHYGENLLNYDSIVCRFDEVHQYFADEFFIRPCEDTKSFPGKIYSWDKFNSWRNDVIELKNIFSTLDASTAVSYCSVKDIYREYRFFVVDGEIITASQYKIGDRIVHSTMIDDDIIEFAKKMVVTWQPSRAFVIDIALTPDECKVIEINNFNSAGFYACDVGKIVDSIEGMKF